MAINLAKYKDALQAAWKDVLDDKTPTDWALFGYEGQTNNLKVVSKGSGGIEEMLEDLNSGKIMYAFCKVLDPKTSLSKCVLINWQGEGAPIVRKGTCANHVRDVASFFKGAHVTLNARTEEEVDSQLIMDKVARSTGAAYSFQDRAEAQLNERAAPVGTTYKKVIPTQEINSQERDKFWEKEELEEKQRQEEERRRREEERLRLECERKERELSEARRREEVAQERNRSISQLREAELRGAHSSVPVPAEQVLSAEEELAEREREELERRSRSDLLRRQRSQEAQAVISQRTINARAVFEQHTSAGQLHSLRRASTAGASTSLPSWPPAQQELQEEPAAVPPTKAALSPVVNSVAEPAPPEETRAPVPDPQVTLPPAAYQEPVKENNTWKGNGVNSNGMAVAELSAAQQVAGQVGLDPDPDALIYDPLQLGSDLGLQARALYDYQAADPTEITFDPGDIITHIDQIDEGWWQGLGPDGTFGLFPANYVELID